MSNRIFLLMFVTIRYLHSLIRYISRRFCISALGKCNKQIINDSIEQITDFKEALVEMSYADGIDKFIYSYKNKAVKPIKILDIQHDMNIPIFICAVKNDLKRVKEQLDYHRKIGVKHFVYIDNLSDDGAFEWLEQQEDVSLLSVAETYMSEIRLSWYRQATDIFGYDKWYLYMDSDEFFAYPGMEQKPINEYIDFLDKNNIKSILTPMIDMYSNKSLFSDSHSLLNDYCYFDSNTYVRGFKHSQIMIHGGPRMRLFAKFTKGKEIISSIAVISKYSLLKAEKHMLHGKHENYPATLNFQTRKARAFLLHYKFIGSDFEKYNEIIKTENYAKGSREYKLYMKAFNRESELSFFYKDSVKYNDSLDLLKIKNITDKKFFKQFL